LGIFEIFKRGKGTVDHKFGSIHSLNFYLLNKIENFFSLKFSHFCSVWEIVVFAKKSKFGENAKRENLTNPY
jgi:hypothetical protein